MIEAKVIKLKASVKRKAIIYSVILVSSVVVQFVVGYALDEIIVKKNAISKEIDDLKTNITSLENKSKEVKDAKKLAERLSTITAKSDGLAIDKVKILIKALEKKYYLSKPIEVNLAPPVELGDLYKTSTTTVMASTMDLKLSGMSDELLLEFIDALMKNCPGFVRLNSLQLTRKNDVIDSLKTESNKQPELPILVEGAIQIDWKDFKSIDKVVGNNAKK